MAITFQYNKTSLQALDKQLKIRKKALPTLKNKESALRVEVKRAKDDAIKYDEELKEAMKGFDNISRLWEEFDSSLISIKEIKLSSKKIAGVVTPLLENISFNIAPYNIFIHPVWFADGISILKYLSETAIKRDVYLKKMKALDYARKKTTQKVNLYEKVQIPGFEGAMRKIKRFLEDEENLSKSAQKIVKTKHLQEVAS